MPKLSSGLRFSGDVNHPIGGRADVAVDDGGHQDDAFSRAGACSRRGSYCANPSVSRRMLDNRMAPRARLRLDPVHQVHQFEVAPAQAEKLDEAFTDQGGALSPSVRTVVMLMRRASWAAGGAACSDAKPGQQHGGVEDGGTFQLPQHVADLGADGGERAAAGGGDALRALSGGERDGDRRLRG
jgi:hypothetical protein